MTGRGTWLSSADCLQRGRKRIFAVALLKGRYGRTAAIGCSGTKVCFRRLTPSAGHSAFSQLGAPLLLSAAFSDGALL
jgi:hypothetical protein